MGWTTEETWFGFQESCSAKCPKRWALPCLLFGVNRVIKRPGREADHSPILCEVQIVWVCTSLSPYAFLESTGSVCLYSIRRFLLSSLETPSSPWGCFIVSDVFRTRTFSYAFLWGDRENLVIDNDVSFMSSSHV